ncbi:ATP-binding protein [Streptacidiphilus jiangxiensis]|uniref:Anti-sigma regulatory factor (Ser/Thr protein kinase) n=1 Tax=Streptacidiphilus jiangxiensis TaxID=235985 RepID=A0A1H7UMS6_STRJI|nr:ATP-binding protein [Streptacidiphilus jiangxiensis]SEL98055.1 Anti-sigma regulatory factor (Ser/Thr protein kinase) [Streptacidiphilus jiangxiensis]
MDPTLAPGPRRAAPGGACRLASTHVLPATAASVPVLRRLAQRTARRWQLPDDTCEALALIVTELATNAVRHSGSPDVRLLLCLAEGGLTVQVRDSGVWRARAVASDAARRGEDLACGGRGLVLVEACAVNCDVRTTAEGTTVTAELIVALPGQAVHAARAESACAVAGPAELTAPTGLTEPAGLAELTRLTELTRPTELSGPTGLTRPTELTGPTRLAELTGPAGPVGAWSPSPCLPSLPPLLSLPSRPARPGLSSPRHRTACTSPALGPV